MRVIQIVISKHSPKEYHYIIRIEILDKQTYLELEHVVFIELRVRENVEVEGTTGVLVEGAVPLESAETYLEGIHPVAVVH